MTRAAAPILPHLAEEVYLHTLGHPGGSPVTQPVQATSKVKGCLAFFFVLHSNEGCITIICIISTRSVISMQPVKLMI